MCRGECSVHGYGIPLQCLVDQVFAGRCVSLLECTV